MKKYTFLLLVALVLGLTSAGKKTVTLFLCGDSTMADKTELEISPERGWGQLFPSYCKSGLVVENYAMNGRSTRSFVDEGRWDYVLGRIHRGDWVLIQFGHNDAKKEDPRRFSTVEEYEENLARMIRQAQEKGANVIVATPICRRYFDEKGEFHLRHGGYPAAAKRAAERAGVPCLDLESATAEWISALGDEASKAYFMNVAPGECTKFPEGKTDNTHLRENGALVVGGMVAKMIHEQDIRGLKGLVCLESSPEPQYTVFCRPSFDSDRKVKQESDMKSFKE